MTSAMSKTTPTDRALRASQVANVLGVHVNTVKRMPRDELPFFLIGTRGDRRYRASDVEFYMRKRGGRMTIAEEYLTKNDNRKIDAAANLAMDLMRGNAREFHQGYSIGSALIAVAGQFELDAESVALVAEWVTKATSEHYSATRRPLVIVHVGGGLVQWTHEKPGLGTPRVMVLDFDREGQVGDELRAFVVELDEAGEALAEYDDPNDGVVLYELGLARNEYQDLIDDQQEGRRYR